MFRISAPLRMSDIERKLDHVCLDLRRNAHGTRDRSAGQWEAERRIEFATRAIPKFPEELSRQLLNAGHQTRDGCRREQRLDEPPHYDVVRRIELRWNVMKAEV